MAPYYDAIISALVEVFRVFLTGLLGYVVMASLKSQWRAVWAPSAKVVEEEDYAAMMPVLATHAGPNRGAMTENFFAMLPTDIDSSMAMFFDAGDVARLGEASELLRDRFWGSPEVWQDLCKVRGFSLPSNLLATREHFRMNFYRILGDGPQILLTSAIDGSRSAVEVLEECSHMLRGLIPYDSMSIVNCILESGEAALWSRVVGDTKATIAAGSFLRALRQSDVVMSWHVDHLEEVLRTTESLDQCMEMTMHKVLAELPGTEMSDLFADVQPDIVGYQLNGDYT